MNNKENYKKAIDQIHASEDLKETAFENAKYAKSNRFSGFKVLSTCAAAVILLLIGMISFNTNLEPKNPNLAELNKEEKQEEIILANAELPRFKNMQELEEALKANAGEYKSIYMDGVTTTLTESISKEESIAQSETNRDVVNDLAATGALSSTGNNKDYSTTNTQVANVDEADIVKTDGEYIYYVLNGSLYIVKADNLEIISNIKINENNERF